MTEPMRAFYFALFLSWCGVVVVALVYAAAWLIAHPLIGAAVLLVLAVLAWSLCAAAGRADDATGVR